MAGIINWKKKTEQYDNLAPDLSEIRLMPRITKGSSAHCILPAGKTSIAVKHKTIEEIWYVLSGEGEMWQKSDAEEEIIALTEGVGLTIPTGNHFQFRNTGSEPLCIFIVSMPPWPGKDEVEFPEGKWK